jgi:hypothetical protein
LMGAVRPQTPHRSPRQAFGGNFIKLACSKQCKKTQTREKNSCMTTCPSSADSEKLKAHSIQRLLQCGGIHRNVFKKIAGVIHVIHDSLFGSEQIVVIGLNDARD